jgi:hypothetical protein
MFPKVLQDNKLARGKPGTSEEKAACSKLRKIDWIRHPVEDIH